MLIRPFYSLASGMALEDFWHDQSECLIGMSIPVDDRLPGKNDMPNRCPYCSLLDKSTERKYVL